MPSIQGTLLQALFPVLIGLIFLAFWAWMFRDMLGNDDLPPDVKETWTFGFIILSVFAAVVYYGAIYRNRR